MILREVTDAEYTGASRYTGYIPKSIHLTLSCGHHAFRKASQGIPNRARCRDCELLSRGGTITYFDADDRTDGQSLNSRKTTSDGK